VFAQNAVMPPTRRERQRTATIESIKEAALEIVAVDGAHSLSIRGIARAIGMSPAGLYRYYDGLDSLITALLADAYNDLADAVADATAAGTVRQRLRAGMLAYRRWCVEHPNRFLLLFGTPIPGFAAPSAGPTVVTARRIASAFLSVVVDGWATGALAPPELRRTSEPAENVFAEHTAAVFPPEWIPAFVSA
jgi:AcrR family transcriptional regulator